MHQAAQLRYLPSVCHLSSKNRSRQQEKKKSKVKRGVNQQTPGKLERRKAIEDETEQDSMGRPAYKNFSMSLVSCFFGKILHHLELP